MKHHFFLIPLLTLVVFSMPSVVHAADFTVTLTPNITGEGGIVTAVITLASDESTNAIEGEVTFPYELMEVRGIQTTDSAVTFWVVPPQVTATGTIGFSGITPGGMQGTHAILTIQFQTRKTGQGVIGLQKMKALLNNGKGTQTPVVLHTATVAVTASVATGSASTTVTDTAPPESFRPQVTRSELLFNGAWFLVFATQDKNTGMSRFEVKESRSRLFAPLQAWHVAQSPYLLADQQRASYIFVRAIDAAGTMRTVELSPQHSFVWYKDGVTWSMILKTLTIFLLLGWLVRIFFRSLWKKHTIKK